jgi:F420-0:gamma-glutamyl ligase
VAEATLKDFLDRVADAIMGSRDASSPAALLRAAPEPA